jgi:DNA-binding response OmpR family regulator
MARILVVDDEAHLRQLARHVLTRDGHDVRLAENGNMAMLAMEMSMPDLVLMDIAMPEMDGVSLLKLMRNTPEWKHIPVLLMSAFATGEQMSMVDELGAAAPLPKAQFSVKELRARVAQELAPKAMAS